MVCDTSGAHCQGALSRVLRFNDDDDDGGGGGGGGDDDDDDDDDDNDNKNNDYDCIQRLKSRCFTISLRLVSPTRTLKWPRRNRVQITCNTSNAYHVQVSCYLPLGTKGQLSY